MWLTGTQTNSPCGAQAAQAASKPKEAFRVRQQFAPGRMGRVLSIYKSMSDLICGYSGWFIYTHTHTYTLPPHALHSHTLTHTHTQTHHTHTTHTHTHHTPHSEGCFKHSSKHHVCESQGQIDTHRHTNTPSLTPCKTNRCRQTCQQLEISQVES